MSYGLLNSARTGRSSLTLLGLNFGSEDMTASSVLLLATSFTVSWTSTTSVVSVSASIADMAAETQVTVAAVAGTAFSTVSFDGKSLAQLHGCLDVVCHVSHATASCNLVQEISVLGVQHP